MSDQKECKKRLTEKQKIKKEQMMSQMEKEIKDLEFNARHSKIVNLKIHMIRKAKSSLCAGQLIAPYVLTAAITFGGFALFNNTPFFKDNIKKNLKIKEEIDSFGNIKYEKTYNNFYEVNSKITYITKWEKKENGFYSREIKTYDTKGIDKKKIKEIINNVNTTSLEKVFGPSTSSVIEVQNNLSQQEKQTPQQIKAIIYYESDDNFIIVKENTSDNVGWTILWFLLTILAEVIPFFIRDQISPYDYKKRINEIKEKYPLINREDLTKKLEIKKNNYNRLTR